MVVTNLNENYETEETMFGLIFSTNVTVLRYMSITQLLFWISFATSKYTCRMVQKQKTKGLDKRVRKDDGSWCSLKHQFGFFFFWELKFFLSLYIES